MRLGNIGDWGSGSTPAKGRPDYYGGNILWLRTGELNNGTVYDTEIKITEKALNECSFRLNKVGDVMIAMYGATIGKVAIAGKEMTTNQACCGCTPICILNKYLFYFLMGSQEDFIKKGEGGAQPNISREKIVAHLMPLPPFEEQNRIVQKIESVLPLIELYGKSQDKLNALNKSIFPLLRKSVLQEAIQGKLVPQDPNDEPASVLLERIKAEKAKLFKEGKLKKKDLVDSVIFKGDDNKYYEKVGSEINCIDDEIPFEIPSNWQWVRLGKVTIVNPRNTISDEMSVGFIPMTNISPGYGNSIECEQRYWKDVKSGFTHIADGDVAFAKITPCFQNRKSFIAANLPNGFAAGTTELNILRPYDNTIDTRYLLWFLKSEYFISEAKFKGTAGQQRVVTDYVLNRLFPLPPVKEQIRISNHLEFVIANIMRR